MISPVARFVLWIGLCVSVSYIALTVVCMVHCVSSAGEVAAVEFKRCACIDFAWRHRFVASGCRSPQSPAHQTKESGGGKKPADQSDDVSWPPPLKPTPILQRFHVPVAPQSAVQKLTDPNQQDEREQVEHPQVPCNVTDEVLKIVAHWSSVPNSCGLLHQRICPRMHPR